MEQETFLLQFIRVVKHSGQIAPNLKQVDEFVSNLLSVDVPVSGGGLIIVNPWFLFPDLNLPPSREDHLQMNTRCSPELFP
ncbi:hypothetical protein AN958_10094 [Leucoagaricus sp. SymC.cos]|nr:hypothetical protein AN958_10094 [Leucoagaricus sp. SymC.cos]